MIKFTLTLILSSIIYYGLLILLEKNDAPYNIKVFLLMFFLVLGVLELSSFIIDVVFYIFNKGSL